MTFLEAKAKLAEIAKDRHHSLQYTLCTHGQYKNLPRTEEPKCGVYIDGYAWHSARTWDEAFKTLTEQMNPPTSVDLTECPEN